MSPLFTEGRPSNLNGWQVEIWVSESKDAKYPMAMKHVGFNKEDALACLDTIEDGLQYMINLSAGFEVYEITRQSLEEFDAQEVKGN